MRRNFFALILTAMVTLTTMAVPAQAAPDTFQVNDGSQIFNISQLQGQINGFAAGSSNAIRLLGDSHADIGIEVNDRTITLDLNGFVFDINSSVNMGLNVINNGTLSLIGIGAFNVEGSAIGVRAATGGTATVTNARSRNNSGSGAHAVGAGSTIHVLNDVSGLRGVFAEGASGAGGSTITVGGNVTGNNEGVRVDNGSKVIIGGSITGQNYIQFGTNNPAFVAQSGFRSTSTRTGYLTYVDPTAARGTVWVRTPPDMTHTVTVTSNGASTTGGGSHGHTSTVNISTTPLPGQRFVNWTTTSPGVILTDADNASTCFTMPNNPVTITANFVGVPSVPSDAWITSVAGVSTTWGGGDGSAAATPKTASINVPNSKRVIAISDVEVPPGVTSVTVYSDAFKTEGAATLQVGANNVHIRVISANSSTLFYNLTVIRAPAGNGSDPGNGGDPNDQNTDSTITLPGGGEARLPVGGYTTAHDGTITLLPGRTGTVTTPSDTTITIPGGTELRPCGTIILPPGVAGTLATSDGNVKASVSGGTMKVGSDGAITLTSAVTITIGNTKIILYDGGTIAEGGGSNAGQPRYLTVTVGRGGATIIHPDGRTKSIHKGYVIKIYADDDIRISPSDPSDPGNGDNDNDNENENSNNNGGGGCNTGVGVFGLSVIFAAMLKFQGIKGLSKRMGINEGKIQRKE